ncbi:MAG TPA: hypothetical protein VGB54_09190 [Allosphingosinicella sp.]|jgi:Tol biopolymer transport system component
MGRWNVGRAALLAVSGWCLLPLQGSAQTSALRPSEPQLLQPGVVSIGGITSYRPAFAPDGSAVYFTVEIGEDYAIAFSTLRRRTWSLPQLMPFSGSHSDAEPFLSPDGSRLFFTSQRPLRAGEPARSDYDIWYVDRLAAGRWGSPRHLGAPVNSAARELYPAVSRDGTLYFSRSDGTGSDLWRAVRRGEGYAEPERLPEPVNSASREAGVYVHPDQRFIIFDSNRPGSAGGTDLYVSFRLETGWSEPRNLGPSVNSRANETSAMVSADGNSLYFASNRRTAQPRIGRDLPLAELIAQARRPGNGLFHVYQVAADTVINPPAE